MLLGQPKTLNDVKDLSQEEIKGLVQMVDSALSSGTPIDMPSMALSILDFARIVKAIRLVEPTVPESAVPAPDEVRLSEGRLDLSMMATPGADKSEA